MKIKSLIGSTVTLAIIAITLGYMLFCTKSKLDDVKNAQGEAEAKVENLKSIINYLTTQSGYSVDTGKPEETPVATEPGIPVYSGGVTPDGMDNVLVDPPMDYVPGGGQGTSGSYPGVSSDVDFGAPEPAVMRAY